MYDVFYSNQLYPLQDKVLEVIRKLNTPFYLTGGTALARVYLNHRYSDDIDLFVNHNHDFKKHVENIIHSLRKYFNGFSIGLIDSDFARLFITSNEINLKVELINDVEYHIGELQTTSWYDKIDHWSNILANKITALSRDEAKDIADVIFLANKYPFQWQEIIQYAKNKDIWVNEIEISKIFATFDIHRFKTLKWISRYNIQSLTKQCKIIATDIIHGEKNLLYKI